MNIRDKHVKKFNRLQKKYGVSLEFVIFNFGKVIKLYNYVTENHFVIKKTLAVKKNKVVIKYNTLRTKLFSSSKNKMKKRKREISWSKRVVNYMKKHINNEIEDAEDNLNESSHVLQSKIKQQLELLKISKKTFSSMPDKNNKLSPLREIFDNTSEFPTPTTSSREVNLTLDLNKPSINEESLILDNFSDSIWNDCNIIDVASISELQEISNNLDENSAPIDTELNGKNGSNKNQTDENNAVSANGLKFIDLLITRMQNKYSKDETSSTNVEEKDNNQEETDIILKNVEIFELDVAMTETQNIDETDDSITAAPTSVENTDQLSKLQQIQIVTNIEEISNNENVPLPEKINSQTTGTALIDNVKPKTGGTNVNSEETSSSSSEFLGFPEYELTPCTVPGMLPTPLVAKSIHDTIQSAFVSEDLENFLRENPRDNSTHVEIPKHKNFEDGLVCDGAQPPKMVMPVVPAELTKPRTVAQKRHILQRKQSIKYYMIENENTIYRELKKRTKFGKANVSLIRYIQKMELPFTRDCWKASSWLSTENGRFYYQILNIDGIEVKLIGTRGNHPTKYMPKQSSKPCNNSLREQCPTGCRQNVDFRNIQINLSSDDEKELDDIKIITAPDLKLHVGGPVDDEKPIYKPGPLSRKCLYSPFKPNLGVLEVYEMPDIQLEIFPAVDKPLDESLKPYLKLILPSKCITRQWAEFAVSTLVTKDENPEPKSFTFTIPYLNNQRNILVRKVYNRREALEKFSTEDFTFRKSLDSENEVAVECADVLSEMINSVAIGMSEDSFIKDDPDIDYSSNKKVNADTRQDSGDDKTFEKKNPVKKKSARAKLVTELKKLNATVIDAECLYSTDDKECKNSYCKFGCVCQSLSGQPILRKHCKKDSCILGCTCKRTIASDLNELISSSLTTEDALLIRKKVTAKLAKVEKDFCATVVFTNKETYLINDSQNDRKRSKRAPKRFDDYDTIDKKEDLSNSYSSIPKLYPYDDEPPPKRFKHCNVDITRLMCLDNLEPWCMVHCLYKCFCKLENITGVPFEIKKEETLQKEEEEICYPRKRLYSFEKDTISNSKEIEHTEKRNKVATSLPENETLDVDKSKSFRIFEKEFTEKRKYFHSGNNLCKRICAVPAQVYKDINKKRAYRIKQKVKAEESDKIKLILANKIYKSFRFDLRQYSEKNNTRSLLKSGTCEQPTYKKCDNINVEEQPIKTKSKSSEQVKDSNETKLPIISSVCSLNLGNDLTNELEKLNATRQSNKLTANTLEGNLNQFISNSSSTPLTSISTPLTSTSASSTSILIPLSNTPMIPSANTSVPHNFFNEIPNNANISNYIHGIAIKKLNAAVTKTMHSICAIQKRNTKIVPPPVLNTLNSHQWKLFLQAYLEGLVYVWEIRITEGSFIAATVKNIMPIIPNALSVINIKAIPEKNLPLLGKMLKAQINNDTTKTLSILMSGQKNFWRIIGFINSSYDYLSRGGIFKPTPQSHPWLSKKINRLFNSLMLRQFKDDQQSQNMPSHLTSNSSSNTFNIYTGGSRSVNANSNAKNAGMPVLQIPLSNLQIKKVTHEEIVGIVIPIAVIGDHRWLVLDIVDDFSHIYIPAWKNFLSHDRIKKAIMLTRATTKIVRIGQEKNTFDVFATPDNRQRIYIGPYDIKKVQDIVLYQNIDSRMMLREEFEKQQNIIRNTKTTGFWLYKRNGKLIFDMDLRALQMSDTGTVSTCTDMPLSEEDCMIVEQETNSELKSKEKDGISPLLRNAPKDNYQIDNSEATPQIINSFGCTPASLSPVISDETSVPENILPAKIVQNIQLQGVHPPITNSLKLSMPRTTENPKERILKNTTSTYAAKKISVMPNNSFFKNQTVNKTSKVGSFVISKSHSPSTNPTIGNVSTMKVAKISSAPSASNIFIIKNPTDIDKSKVSKSTKSQKPEPQFESQSSTKSKKFKMRKDCNEIENISEILKECDISLSTISSSQGPMYGQTKSIDKTPGNQLPIGTPHQIVAENSGSNSNLFGQKLLGSITMSGPHPSINSTSKSLVTTDNNSAVQSSSTFASTSNSIVFKKVPTEKPVQSITTSLMTQVSNSTNINTITKASTTITPLSRLNDRKLKPNKIDMKPLIPETKNLQGSVKKMYLTTISSTGQPTTSTVSLTTTLASQTSELGLKSVTTGSNQKQLQESKVAPIYRVKDILSVGQMQKKDAITTTSTGRKLKNFFSESKIQTLDSVAALTKIKNQSVNQIQASKGKVVASKNNSSQMQTNEAKNTTSKSNSGTLSGSQMQANETKVTVASKGKSDVLSGNQEPVVASTTSTLNDIFSGSQLEIKEDKVVASTSNSDTVKYSNENNGSIQLIHEPEYGYIMANKPNFGKYPVKRLGDVYLLKMPNLKGILRIMGIHLVNKYLAQYMKKHADTFPSITPDLKWDFIPYKSIKLKNPQQQDDQKDNTKQNSDDKKKGPVVNVITVQKLPPYKKIEKPTQENVVNDKATSTKLSKLKTIGTKRKSNNQEALSAKPAKLIIKAINAKRCSTSTSVSNSSGAAAKSITATNLPIKLLKKADSAESTPLSSKHSQSRPQQTETIKPISEVILIDDDD